MDKIIFTFIIFFSAQVLSQNWTGSTIPETYQKEILRPAFTAPIAVGESMHKDPVQNLDQLKNEIDQLLVPITDLNTIYDRIDLLEHKFEDIPFGMANSRFTLSFEFEKILDAHAYFLKGSPESNPGSTAILIIPGSGLNQSSAIVNQTIHNYHGDIARVASGIGDTFVLVKPNEDYMAIHNGANKVNYDFIYTQLINYGGSYSYTYMVNALGLAKYLKSHYEEVAIVGLSQGGAATLICSLQAEPEYAVVSSGYSILLQELNWAGCNQLMIPGLDTLYTRDKIKTEMNQSSTKYLFTWGLQETDYYLTEANLLLTADFFSDTPSFFSHVHQGGHEFPEEQVHQFLTQGFISPLFPRIVNVNRLDGLLDVTVSGYSKSGAISFQRSDNLVDWGPIQQAVVQPGQSENFVIPIDTDKQNEFLRLLPPSVEE